MKCPFCGSDKALETTSFGSRGKVAICASCYNNPMLRQQLIGRFRVLFEAVSSGPESDSAKQEIFALAMRYKLPRPEIF